MTPLESRGNDFNERQEHDARLDPNMPLLWPPRSGRPARTSSVRHGMCGACTVQSTVTRQILRVAPIGVAKSAGDHHRRTAEQAGEGIQPLDQLQCRNAATAVSQTSRDRLLEKNTAPTDAESTAR